MQTDLKVESCLAQVRQGFASGKEPILTADGTSGAYILKNESGSVAIFKPIDEEPFAPHNPREMQGLFGSETCRAGVKSGESTLREVAAYLLDKEGFHGVPATSLVEMRHKVLPAIQITDEQITSQEQLDMLSELVPIKRIGKIECDKIDEVSETSYSTVNSEAVFSDN